MPSTQVELLDLSHNQFSGTIPFNFGQLQPYIIHLSLSHNDLSGPIPPSSLIPKSLQNCISLETLDLGNNQLNGSIPSWLGEKLPSLRNLRLRSNQLTGQIPFQLIYTSTLSLITSIDLSGNSLSGEIPQTLTDLNGLINLNLSENHLTGKIPGNIGGMHELESLDLSNNQLFGEIPTNMSFIRFLSVLNISNNNLSGEIPPGGQFGTFNPSSFSGNRFLCGPPLDIVCEENDRATGGISDAGEDSEEEWFYLSVGLGYAVGLLGLVAVVLVRKSWGDAYLEFIDWLIEMVMTMKRRAHGSSPER
ncbi:hypothetical protein KSP39_PZI013178 [Platanthera zijinensis]|uniref:Uncharacterized protein n=1 Tax=Platanthera zijinensis TaxID=2320716 RepID=A0AAP0G332_9ASPA